MIHSRATPPSTIVTIAMGIVGLLAGVLSAVLANPWFGLLAGIAAAAAVLATVAGRRVAGGAVVDNDDTVRHERSDPAADERLAAARRDLDAARRRISELEAALRDPSPSAPVDPQAALMDQETGLLSQAYFQIALGSRIAAARRHLRPVAVALIEVLDGQDPAVATIAPPSRTAEAIRQTVREADTACRLDDGSFALLLEDTPENGAVWTVERVRRNLVSRYGAHTMRAGVACYPAHAFSTDELLTQAHLALRSAREWNQDRIEVAIAE